MADLPLATDEMRRQLALSADRQYGIDPGEGNTRGYAFNQFLPLSTNRVGSPSWVQQGADPQLAVPQVAQGGLLGVAGMADAPRTGKLTPEALGSLLTGSTLGGGLLAPRGSLAAGGAIKAYHGSPHDFDRFSFENIGTGEGAQSYGHGLYFAEKEGTARSYRDALASGGATINGVPVRDLAAQKYRLGINETPTPHQNVADYVSSYQDNARYMMQQRAPELVPIYDELKKTGALKDAGHMYEVNINADPQKFLDWDKPLTGQTPEVQKALADAWIAHPEAHANMRGANIYESSKLVPGDYRDPAAASAALSEAGIPGVRYLDQGSRGPSTIYNVGSPRADFGPYSPYSSMAEAQKQLELLRSHGFSDAEIKQQAQPQTSNYVVFPTQDEIIQILRKYGLAAPSPVVPSPQGAASTTPGLLSDQQSEIPMQGRVY